VSFWCLHQDEIIGTSYNPPAAKADHVEGYELIRMLTEGVTNIYFKCSKCGRISEQRVYGKFDPPNRNL
jgi:hypothetical protein